MKISQITFTRFVAALAIVISHFNKDLFLYQLPYISEIFLRANVGVSYFFILSGFIMVIAYHRKEKIAYTDFYRNRFARIYPLYIVGVALYLITRYSGFNIYDLMLYLSGLQSWIPGKALVLNFPGWSISVEFLFYLLFPFLYNRYYSRKNKSIWVITAIIWLTTQVFSNLYVHSSWYEGPHTDSHELGFYFPLLHLNQFLAGNLAGLLFIRKPSHKNYDKEIILLLIAILLSLIFIPLNFHNGLMAVFFIPLIFLISRNNGLLTKVFSWKPLEYSGEISYAMYIVHIPVLYILRAVCTAANYNLSNDIVFLIYIPVLILISALLYETVEKPLRNVLKSKSKH
ncbi:MULTISPECIES: acyltransferase family protein [Chryseobacterium]|uniref:Peptidoglycan/LPS O-acetylase OafA/YrhL n=1 Tax=Chryseobacterium camelliae TaxID=1265445 RepID=A0ABU0TNX9_9FLAO|nr:MULTISPECIES: acyltransferase [Chryseobacterium]MDT3407626.1 peptidoglycan/LPS O-acetylase OafA/YrhL [Pseudacidovorax intermedius]MDQ1098521.1 peptidoglycan/LPS O-acetylase OafA/YrhL [Chryseobacterium camelliae]MDQ1102445.1 peptidoglycan/LPS O-acetylase OafA/YrhL [Chryseobacterium sp. SORGH_AS_1048]MDR6085879.1 peptidoglycan/LPS O-acetylase OafA/YrhL [Chryseobacterium sp. SORGH_AS_0909]MDR6130246.1 peptidoglycan/LPS O-acetylase OafA/YrhL [Chryseobacterium sp. SORGH_AS_1175]